MTIFGNSQLTFGVTVVRGGLVEGGMAGRSGVGRVVVAGDLGCKVQPEFKRDLTSSTLQAESVSGKDPEACRRS